MAIRQTLRACRWTYICATAFTLLTGLMPSLQIFLVQRLSGSGSGSDGDSMINAALAGCAIAGYLGMSNASNSLLKISQIKTYTLNMEELNRKIVRLDPKDIADKETQGKCASARDSVLQGAAQLQATSAISAVQAIVVVTSLAFSVSRTSVLAAFFVVCSVVPMVLASMWYATQDAKIWPLISEERRVANYNEEQITYQTTALELASLNARQSVARRAMNRREALRDKEVALERKSLCSDVLASVGATIFLVLSLISLVLSGASSSSVTGGVIGIFSGIVATSNVGFVIGSLRSGSNAIGRYLNFMRLPERTSAVESVDLGGEDADSLTVSGLSIRYSTRGQDTISNVSLKVDRGEMVGLVGVNGAGKSTLIEGVSGLVDVRSGTISIGSQEVGGAGHGYTSRSISLMSQDYGRYEFTVREFLLLGVERGCSDGDMWKSLHEVGLDGFVGSLPAGLDSQLGEQWGGVGLSGGQWQRLALARIFLRDSGVWILDEPTSAIDAEAEGEIFAHLRDRARSRAILVVSHRAWTLKHMDRIYVMDEGRIVETGIYAELMTRRGKFTELFQSQRG